VVTVELEQILSALELPEVAAMEAVADQFTW
jgi:hypothetical protein